MDRDSDDPGERPPALPRLPTRVPGLDAVLSGGLIVGDSYLIVGAPGTGKTTLGNQLAFAHAAAGGTALVATLLTETHDRMLGHLRGFDFFDPSLANGRIRYLSLLRPLEENGVDGLLEALRLAVRDQGTTMLVVDGTTAAEELAPSGFAYGRFVQGLQARSAILGCTTVLLSNAPNKEHASAASHVDGVVELMLDAVDSRDERWLRVVKLRGSAYISGRHHFTIAPVGVEVFPRLEATIKPAVPPALGTGGHVAFGVAGLDAMLGGGLPSDSTAMVLGTPGAGKTLLGLHFLVEGARRGEPGLIASFHESAESLVASASKIGLDLEPHVRSGLVRIIWRAPLELTPDAWGWDLLSVIEAHQPRRLVIDAFTDVGRLFTHPDRQVSFLAALTNRFRAWRITTLVNVELDAYSGPGLIPPIPAVSATMDNGILLRTTELDSRLVRLASILKARQIGFDHSIREFVINADGIELGNRFGAVAGLLTGNAETDAPPAP